MLGVSLGKDKVIDRGLQGFRIILRVADHNIAPDTQQTAHNARTMVVVHSKPASVGRGRTNRAYAFLARKDGLVFGGCDTKLDFELCAPLQVGPSIGIVRDPLAHKCVYFVGVLGAPPSLILARLVPVLGLPAFHRGFLSGGRRHNIERYIPLGVFLVKAVNHRLRALLRRGRGA